MQSPAATGRPSLALRCDVADREQTWDLSVAGMRGDAGYGPYAASKEAIRALTRVAAREWAR